jgi:hypothetical protein
MLFQREASMGLAKIALSTRNEQIDKTKSANSDAEKISELKSFLAINKRLKSKLKSYLRQLNKSVAISISMTCATSVW